ncbi:MAG: hypothetical protein JWO80_2319 [Bryobacterales bacterium]|nr:hypothetical protein [Bryobacterales bacterium]
MNFKRWLVFTIFAVSTLTAAPQLQLSTGAIGIININAGANGPVQTVSATNAGDGSLNLSVSSTASWLVPSVVNGAVQIALNTSSLTPGTYTEFVTVNSPGAVDAPQTISVTAQILGAPSSVELYAAPNGGKATTQFNTQSQVKTAATTSTGGNWLVVALNGQGSFAFYFPYLVTATSQPGQAEGAYSGTITTSGGATAADNKTIPVTFHVTSQPITQFSPSPLLLYGAASGAKVTSNVSVTNAGQGTLAISGATGTTTSGGNWLSGAAVDNGTVAVTADPSGLAAGTYRGTLTIASNAANATTNTLPVEFVVSQTSAPIISFGGVVDNAVGKPVLAPGDIASAYGFQLAGPTPVGAATLPLTNNLAGVQVFVNNLPAPVYYVSAGQVNFEVPTAVQPGPATLRITVNGQAGNTVSSVVAQRAPRILKLNTANYGIIVNQDGSFPMPATPGFNSHPARAGDALVIYAIGLGATTPAVPDGTASPTSPLAVTNTPIVNFGGGFASPPMPGQVLFSGLTPGFVGLYQVNVIVPQGTPIGDTIGLIMQVDGFTSNNVNIAIGQ